MFRARAGRAKGPRGPLASRPIRSMATHSKSTSPGSPLVMFSSHPSAGGAGGRGRGLELRVMRAPWRLRLSGDEHGVQRSPAFAVRAYAEGRLGERAGLVGAQAPREALRGDHDLVGQGLDPLGG